MKTLIMKINIDNPEVSSGLSRLYNKLREKRSDRPDAVKVFCEVTCWGKKRKAFLLPFKVKLDEDDIAFIRGITETILDVESILNLGAI